MGRLPIVVKQHGCLVDILGGVRTNPNFGVQASGYGLLTKIYRNRVIFIFLPLYGSYPNFGAILLLFKGELQRENKLISYERAFKMLENDMYIAEISQVVLELLSFKVESGNHRRGISLLQKFSDIFGNMRLVPLKMTSQLTSHNFQILKIEIFSKLCKI